MAIWYTIYTDKNINCQWCKKAIILLQCYGKNYHEVDLTEPGIKQMFSQKGFKTVPQVYVEDTHIGGYNALEEFLRKENYDKTKIHKNGTRIEVFKTA